MKKKVLITGSNGMLGKDVVSILSKNHSYEIFGLNRKIDNRLDNSHSIICDLNDFEKLEAILVKVSPDIIIHTAANINLNVCEENYEMAKKINVESTELLAKFSKDKSRLIYISTDSVFDGKKSLYTEDDKTMPLNNYALSKLLGENAVIKNANDYVIVRTNIYGFNNPPKKSLIEWALGELEETKTIYGFNDVFFNPLYTGQLATIIFDLMMNDFIGIINVGCEKGISKLEFLRKLSLQFGYNLELIKEKSVDEILSSLKRPKNTVLDILKLKEILGYEVSLDRGIKMLFEDYRNQFNGGHNEKN